MVEETGELGIGGILLFSDFGTYATSNVRDIEATLSHFSASVTLRRTGFFFFFLRSAIGREGRFSLHGEAAIWTATPYLEKIEKLILVICIQRGCAKEAHGFCRRHVLMMIGCYRYK